LILSGIPILRTGWIQNDGDSLHRANIGTAGLRDFETGFVWLCFITVASRLNLLKALSTLNLRPIGPPGNWVCFFNIAHSHKGTKNAGYDESYQLCACVPGLD
jgi:hypothetical protein